MSDGSYITEQEILYEAKILELLQEIKKLKYELHIARTSAILLKHSIDGGYD
jgi:hypothetical protein